jgi:hypothetical protein
MSVRFCIAVFLLVAAPSAIPAQTIRGDLVGAATAQPIAYALVLLVDSAGHERARTLSDAAGQFVLLAPSPGTYRVRILRIGFKSFESPDAARGG